MSLSTRFGAGDDLPPRDFGLGLCLKSVLLAVSSSSSGLSKTNKLCLFDLAGCPGGGLGERSPAGDRRTAGIQQAPFDAISAESRNIVAPTESKSQQQKKSHRHARVGGCFSLVMFALAKMMSVCSIDTRHHNADKVRSLPRLPCGHAGWATDVRCCQ